MRGAEHIVVDPARPVRASDLEFLVNVALETVGRRRKRGQSNMTVRSVSYPLEVVEAIAKKYERGG